VLRFICRAAVTQTDADLIGIIPMCWIFLAQAVGTDAFWLGANIAYLLYHLFCTHLYSQACASVVLIAICLVRIYRKRK